MRDADDFAEAERRDGEVVAAEAEGGQADDEANRGSTQRRCRRPG